MQVRDHFRLAPVMKWPPRAGVILPPEPVPFQPVAARWAVRVPRAALTGLQRLKDASPSIVRQTGPALLARAAHTLEPVPERQSQLRRLGQLEVVGLGDAGTLALHLVLHHQGCLRRGIDVRGENTATSASSCQNLSKVRLIGYADGARRVRDEVTTLTARGTDTRAVARAGSGLSKERFGMEAPISASWSAWRSAVMDPIRGGPYLHCGAKAPATRPRGGKNRRRPKAGTSTQGLVIQLTQDKQRRHQCDDLS